MNKTDNNWKLKDILMIAVTGVLFGVIFLGATYSGGFLSGLLTPLGMAQLGYEPFYGIYFMAGAFGGYVLRRPGAAVISEMLAAIIECLLGNYFGPIIILSGFVQGIGIEIVLALFRYKRYDLGTIMLASVCCSVITMGYNLVISGYSAIAPSVLLIMLVVRIISALLITACFTKYLADSLAKAGVLRGYAISQGMEVPGEEA